MKEERTTYELITPRILSFVWKFEQFVPPFKVFYDRMNGIRSKCHFKESNNKHKNKQTINVCRYSVLFWNIQLRFCLFYCMILTFSHGLSHSNNKKSEISFINGLFGFSVLNCKRFYFVSFLTFDINSK